VWHLFLAHCEFWSVYREQDTEPMGQGIYATTLRNFSMYITRSYAKLFNHMKNPLDHNAEIAASSLCPLYVGLVDAALRRVVGQKPWKGIHVLQLLSSRNE
jgi:hypothetical protein